MKLPEIVKRVRETGLECSADIVRRYEKERLLPPSTGGGGKGSAVLYPDSAFPMLLLLLTLKKEPPLGLGLYQMEELREFLGTQEQAGSALPLLLYLFDLPGSDIDTARGTAAEFLATEVKLAKEDSKAIQYRTDGLPALLSVVLGERPYQDPAIYADFEDPDNAGIHDCAIDHGEPTLRDELIETISGFTPLTPKLLGVTEDEYKSASLNADDLATLAKISNASNKLRAVQQAPEEVLALAAMSIRVLFAGGMWKMCKPPYANGLIHAWLFASSAFTLYPAWIEVARIGTLFAPQALKTVEEAGSPSRGESFFQYAERMIPQAIAAVQGEVQ